MLTVRNVQNFWRNVTAGLTVEQLWTQFRREARASVAVFSAETGRDVSGEWSQRGGRGAVVRSVIRAMFYRLSPARRVLLLLAVFLAVTPRFEYSSEEGGVQGKLPQTEIALVFTCLNNR